MIAVSHADAATVLSILDYPAYFELLDQPFPEDREKILSRLADDRLIVRDSSAKWDITQLGAILFARNLQEIKSLARKAIRIVVYEGRNRLRTLREQTSQRGYAAGFERLVELVNALLPRTEVVGQAIRTPNTFLPGHENQPNLI